MTGVSMNLRLSEEQADQLRAQAALENRSMQSVAVTAISEYIARRNHRSKVRAAIQDMQATESGVLRRLGEV